jgi:16S rRNA (uracil1498-N3)-methyltransferase
LVGRGARPTVATFYAQDLGDARTEVALDAAAAHHAAVRRLGQGDVVRLTDGAGRIAMARIRALRKTEVVADLDVVKQIPRPPVLHVLAPVADRERMLWLAEKCAEFGVTTWQPVVFARSRSVVPRGEGEAFRAKVRARMVAALEQSGGAWLPEIRRELPLEAAAASVLASTRFLLDRGGGPLDAAEARHGAAVAFGPEGGIEPDERALLEGSGWKRAAVAPTTLRFETAGIAAVAILRAAVNTADVEE